MKEDEREKGVERMKENVDGIVIADQDASTDIVCDNVN